MKEYLLHKQHPAGSRMTRQSKMAASTVAAGILPAVSSGILPPGTPANGERETGAVSRCAQTADTAALPRRAEERLPAQQQTPQSAADTARHVHELEVHQIELERLIAELQTTLARVKQLSGLLPICANCKKIRDDQGYWKRLEAYIASHSEATFTHGICPECFHKLYPKLDDPVDSIRNLIAPFAKQPAWAHPPGNHPPEKLQA